MPHPTCPIGPACRAARIYNRSQDLLRRTRMAFLVASATFLLGACDGDKPDASMANSAEPPQHALPEVMPKPENPANPLPGAAPPAPADSGAPLAATE